MKPSECHLEYQPRPKSLKLIKSLQQSFMKTLIGRTYCNTEECPNTCLFPFLSLIFSQVSRLTRSLSPPSSKLLLQSFLQAHILVLLSSYLTKFLCLCHFSLPGFFEFSHKSPWADPTSKKFFFIRRQGKGERLGGRGLIYVVLFLSHQQCTLCTECPLPISI